MMRLAEKDSCIRWANSAAWAWAAWTDLRALRPKMTIGTTQSGKTTSEIKVSRGCCDRRTHTTEITVIGSLIMDAKELAMTLCRAAQSLFKRDISSPVRAV